MNKLAVAVTAAGTLLLSSVGVLAANTLNSTDQTFARDAAQSNLAEVALGNLAIKNGQSAEVKQFGKRMVSDHSKANERLMDVAIKQGITLPQQPKAADIKEENRLSKLKGEAFDRAYMRHMVKDHQNDVALFKQEAANGRDPGLKDFAKRTLSVLDTHLKLARGVSSKEHSAAHQKIQAGGGKRQQ